jgi:hypothetical protein
VSHPRGAQGGVGVGVVVMEEDGVQVEVLVVGERGQQQEGVPVAGVDKEVMLVPGWKELWRPGNCVE